MRWDGDVVPLIAWSPRSAGAVKCDIRAVQDLMSKKGVTLGTGRNMEVRASEGVVLSGACAAACVRARAWDVRL